MQTANVKPPITQSVAFYPLFLSCSLSYAPATTHWHALGDTWRHMVTCTHSHTHTWVQMSGTFVYQSCQQLLQHGNYPETRLSFWSTHQHHTHTHFKEEIISSIHVIHMFPVQCEKKLSPFHTPVAIYTFLTHFLPVRDLLRTVWPVFTQTCHILRHMMYW